MAVYTGEVRGDFDSRVDLVKWDNYGLEFKFAALNDEAYVIKQDAKGKWVAGEWVVTDDKLTQLLRSLIRGMGFGRFRMGKGRNTTFIGIVEVENV
jgi:hypothetical protein